MIPSDFSNVEWDAAWLARTKVTVRCALCPKWKRTVPMTEQAAVFQAHRLEKHEALYNKERARVKCHFHLCPKRVTDPSGLCPEHREEVARNVAGRRVKGWRTRPIIKT